MTRDDELTLDPFTAHRAFGERVGVRPPRVADDRGGMPCMRPMDPRPERMIDLDELERIAAFQGLRPDVREKPDHEYPVELEEAMRDCEPQFILRNLDRVERDADPDDPLEYERERFAYGLDVEGADEARHLEFERPTFLERLNVDRVRERLAWRRWLYDEVEWEQHFCREIKEEAPGPLWKHGPYAHERIDPPDEDTSGEPGDEDEEEPATAAD